MPRTVEALTARYGPGYRWGVMAMAMMSTISAVLSATIVNVAIPDIMGSFGIDQVQAQWLSSGYLACMAITMVLVDWSTRSIGQPLVMALSLSAFLVFSIVGGLAENVEILSLSRVVQGAAAGFMQPLAMIAVMQVFPPERRGTAMGIYGVGAVLAPGVGPFFGGLLMDAFNWRFVFFIGAPLSAVALALTLLFMPQPTRSGPRPPFDWLGVLLMALTLGCAMTALTDGAREGWHDTSVVVRFVTAGASVVAFVLWELRAPAPMLDMRIFARPAFAGAAIVSVILGAGLFGSTYLLPLFVQIVQGLTPTISGAILLPAGISMIFLTPLTGRLADRIDPGTQVGFGMALFAVSFWLMAGAELRTASVTLALWLMVSRVGMGFIFPALSAGGVRALPPESLAQGASALNLLRQLGGALGVSLLAVMLEDRIRTHAADLTVTQTPGRDMTAEYLGRVEALAARGGLSDAEQSVVALDHLSRTLQGQAFSLAFNDVFLIGTGAFVFALAGAALMNARCRRTVRALLTGGRVPAAPTPAPGSA